MNITLVGCGKMGSALLRGWLDANIIDKAFILDPSPLPSEFETTGDTLQPFTSPQDYATAAPQTDVLILAVKPQIMDDVCTPLKGMISPQTLIISIAAGRTLNSFAPFFSTPQPLIRAMPNTPAAIGKGITALIANTHVTAAQKQQASALMGTAGQTVWLEDEPLMDAVTALSGSGPAYIFLLIDILAKAGEKSGLPADTAMMLARQTVIGAAALAEDDSATSAETLRQNVTSPGGTTEAALSVLRDGRLQNLFDEALTTAVKRGQALAKKP